MNKQIEELKEKIKKLRESVDPLKAAKQHLEQLNTRLQIDLKKRTDEQKILYKKIRKLESGANSRIIDQEIKDTEQQENSNGMNQEEGYNEVDNDQEDIVHQQDSFENDGKLDDKDRPESKSALNPEAALDDDPLKITKKPVLDRNTIAADATRNHELANADDKKAQSDHRENTPQLTGFPLKIYKTVTRLKDISLYEENVKQPNSEHINSTSPMHNQEDDNIPGGTQSPSKGKPKKAKVEDDKNEESNKTLQKSPSKGSKKVQKVNKSPKSNKKQQESVKNLASKDHSPEDSNSPSTLIRPQNDVKQDGQILSSTAPKAIRPVPTDHKQVQTQVETSEMMISTDVELLNQLVNEKVQMFVKDHFTNVSPIRHDHSEKSIPTLMYDRSDGIESRVNQIYTDESQHIRDPNYILQTQRTDAPTNEEVARGSVNQEYFSNSPILSKNSIHHMSNNSTVLPASVKHGISQAEVHRHYVNNPTPTVIHDINKSINYTEDPQPTQRSDDLMNTSTELEPTSRQSLGPKPLNMSSLQ